MKVAVAGLAVSTALTAVAALSVAGGSGCTSVDLCILLISTVTTALCGVGISIFTITRG
jgi:hypothetical protein